MYYLSPPLLNATFKLLDTIMGFEGVTLLTPIHSALTGEHPSMDRDVLPQPGQKPEVTSSETGSYKRVPVLFILDILCNNSRHVVVPL